MTKINTIKELSRLRNILTSTAKEVEMIIGKLGSEQEQVPVRRIKAKSSRKDKYRAQLKKTA